MSEPSPADPEAVLLTGWSVMTAAGRGPEPLMRAVLAGAPAVSVVERFDVSRFRVKAGATLPDAGELTAELADAALRACDDAGLDAAHRATCPLFLAASVDSTVARAPAGSLATAGAGATAVRLAADCGLAGARRAYTTGCVAASTAVADAAAMIAHRRQNRIMVLAGFVLDADHFGLFDAGRVLADDHVVRPFSAGRRGMLLGDAVAAVVLESATAARRRGATAYAQLAGWARTGDGYHVCQPHPAGDGLARAIEATLRRAGIGPDLVGYVNAHGAGTPQSDCAETAALRRAFGEAVHKIPVSSTKAVHGHTLEASGLLELIVTALTLRLGQLPFNAGFQGPDEDCQLDLILDEPRAVRPQYALSLTMAFGGANTALLLGPA